jgi:hypothetical protein
MPRPDGAQGQFLSSRPRGVQAEEDTRAMVAFISPAASIWPAGWAPAPPVTASAISISAAAVTACAAAAIVGVAIAATSHGRVIIKIVSAAGGVDRVAIGAARAAAPAVTAAMFDHHGRAWCMKTPCVASCHGEGGTRKKLGREQRCGREDMQFHLCPRGNMPPL